MSLTLYSQPFITPHGRVTQSTLTVDAVHPYGYYMDYPYLGVHTSDTPCNGGNWERVRQCQRGLVEWLLRDRRCIAFSDASGLQPVSRPEHCALPDEVRRVITPDHESVWQASDGTGFVMTEPYGNRTTYYRHEKALRLFGYHSIPIPASLAPYNPGALGTVGAEPKSYSQLICREEDGERLVEIAAKLAARALGAPAWNDASGVRTVPAGRVKARV
jgi:hypothetical protein